MIDTAQLTNITAYSRVKDDASIKDSLFNTLDNRYNVLIILDPSMIRFSHMALLFIFLLSGCDKDSVIQRNIYFTSSNIWPDVQYHFALQPSEHKLVKKQIAFYQKHPHMLIQSIEPSAIYMPYILGELKKRKMPAELALLPIVESTYNPFAHSHVGASGLWQMMPGTASRYGLKINYWFDGRRDLIDSTQAALDHLQYLYRHFNDWTLAIAAYDGGEGRVSRAVKAAGNAHVSVIDLNIPQETKHYVIKLLALKELVNHPSRYQIELPYIPKHIGFSQVESKRSVILPKLAKHLQMSEQDLRRLNPGFRRHQTSPNGHARILVPKDKLQAALKYISMKKTSVQTYTVKRKDTLYAIAKKFNTSPSSLAAINHIPQKNQLKPGQKLQIPNQHHTSSLPREELTMISADNKPGPKQIIHIYQKDDTLESIGAQYHVNADHVIYWNKEKMPPSPGTRLVIWRHKKTVPYVVKKGDNLNKIAKTHHVSLKDLLAVNHIAPPYTIRIGQSIEIPL